MMDQYKTIILPNTNLHFVSMPETSVTRDDTFCEQSCFTKGLIACNNITSPSQEKVHKTLKELNELGLEQNLDSSHCFSHQNSNDTKISIIQSQDEKKTVSLSNVSLESPIQKSGPTFEKFQRMMSQIHNNEKYKNLIKLGHVMSRHIDLFSGQFNSTSSVRPASLQNLKESRDMFLEHFKLLFCEIGIGEMEVMITLLWKIGFRGVMKICEKKFDTHLHFRKELIGLVDSGIEYLDNLCQKCNCKPSKFKIYLYLGDLLKWQGLVLLTANGLSKAETHYRCAQQIDSGSAKPYKKIAELMQHTGTYFSTAYYYIRSLACKKRKASAKESLLLCINNILSKRRLSFGSAKEINDNDKPDSTWLFLPVDCNKLEAFEAYYLDVHGKLLTDGLIDDSKIYNMLCNLRVLFRYEHFLLNPSELMEITAISIYVTDCTARNDKVKKISSTIGMLIFSVLCETFFNTAHPFDDSKNSPDMLNVFLPPIRLWLEWLSIYKNCLSLNVVYRRELVILKNMLRTLHYYTVSLLDSNIVRKKPTDNCCRLVTLEEDKLFDGFQPLKNFDKESCYTQRHLDQKTQFAFVRLWKIQQLLEDMNIVSDEGDMMRVMEDKISDEVNVTPHQSISKTLPSNTVVPEFLVLDTNCFVNHLEKVDSLISTKAFRIVIPELVVHELNKLTTRGRIPNPHDKMQDIPLLKRLCSKACLYLKKLAESMISTVFFIDKSGTFVEYNENFSQSYSVSYKTSFDTNDEMIITSAINFKKSLEDQYLKLSDDFHNVCRVVLLSGDKKMQEISNGQRLPCVRLTTFFKWVKL